MGGILKSVGDTVSDYVKDSTFQNGWNGFRDANEATASTAGNYFLPGSGLITNGLTSKGSQAYLDSPVGKVANIAAGLSGAGVGSATTGIPSAAQAGAGWSGLGNTLGVTGEGSLLGTAAGTPLEGGAQGATQGSGILGTANKGLSSLGSALSTGTGGGGSSYAPALIGGATSLYENEQARKALQDAETQSIGQLNPYLQSGAAANSRLSDLLGTSGNSGASGYGSLTTPFTAADLQNDPGYQFQLEEGNKALDRKSAASGNYFSGSALKAAQDYGQGLADTTLNQAYQRYLSGNQQQYSQLAGQAGVGANAATQAGNIYSGTGNAQAGADISTGNIINQTLSSLLSGSGAKRPINVGGQIVYI